jgi:hypothetical protein
VKLQGFLVGRSVWAVALAMRSTAMDTPPCS